MLDVFVLLVPLTILTNCIIRDAINASAINVELQESSLLLDTCQIYNSNAYNIACGYGGNLIMTNCTVDSGANGSTYGVSASRGDAYLDNCVFGGTATHVTADLYCTYAVSRIYARNCKFNSTKLSLPHYYYNGLVVYEEDVQQVYGTHLATGKWGTVERVTDIVRPGGAISSMKVIPASIVVTEKPFLIRDDMPPNNATFRVWCPILHQQLLFICAPSERGLLFLQQYNYM